MTRISKDPDERRLELVMSAEKLFNEKGFDNTSVSDIVKSIGVAQGTFYYYFKSKEDIFITITEYFLNEFMESFSEIADNDEASAREKIEVIFDKAYELLKKKEGIMFYLHTKDNMELHEKVERKFIEYATPLAVKLVKQGMDEKLFSLEQPEEVVGFLMAGSHYLGDVYIYLEDKDSYFRRLQAVLYVVQKTLGIDETAMEHFRSRHMNKLIKLFM